MVNAAYYRRQADLCLQLALAQADPRVAVELVELAEELKAKAGNTASAVEPMPAPMATLKEMPRRRRARNPSARTA